MITKKPARVKTNSIVKGNKKDVNSAVDRAKDDVLGDSSDTADEEEGSLSKLKKKDKKKGSDEKAKPASRKKAAENEKFMRVKLDASDSSDNEEKASKRQDKIKAELDEKKKKRNKNAVSSDDEIVEIKEGKAAKYQYSM